MSVIAEDVSMMKEKSNLMLVVRTSFGANKVDQKLVQTGPLTITDNEGKEHKIELAHYEYIGDTHIRFVFDSKETMRNVTTEEFKALKLSSSEAVKIAIQNIHRDYGKPKLYKLEQGIYQIQGNSPDFDSSYFLDHSLWKNLSDQFKDTIIVAVPSRELLLFSPLKGKKSVAFLSDNVKEWFSESDTQGVSSALYSYKDGNWTVFQKAKLGEKAQ